MCTGPEALLGPWELWDVGAGVPRVGGRLGFESPRVAAAKRRAVRGMGSGEWGICRGPGLTGLGVSVLLQSQLPGQEVDLILQVLLRGDVPWEGSGLRQGPMFYLAIPC